MTFDASVDFDTPGELENSLNQVIRLIGDYTDLTVIVRHDSEIAEVYKDDETIEKPVDTEDWCVTGNSVWGIAAALRALLHA